MQTSPLANTAHPVAQLDAAGLTQLRLQLNNWAHELGFAQLAVSDVDLSQAQPRLEQWLAQGFHGQMDYMKAHGLKRAQPDQLVPGTVRIITVRMNYLSDTSQQSAGDVRDWLARAHHTLNQPHAAYISRYALGRDYHKVIRNRLQALAERISGAAGQHGYRCFTDSAPVMEVEIARKGGLGWRGKHTLLLNREGGSMFFLGEIFTTIPLPVDEPVTEHCGSCTACIDACPTQAIVADKLVDARRCISYLTIELKDSIPEEFRAAMGNRIYGCDDCQLVCPWNKYAQRADVADFGVRHRLDHASLVELFAWTEQEFDERMLGSAIRRIGYERWLRNIAVALGNVPRDTEHAAAAHAALTKRVDDPSSLVREHVAWALSRLNLSKS